HLDLRRIDHDHEVTGVAVRGVLRLALAAKGVGDLGGEAAQGSALSVDDVPVALPVLGCCYVGLHLDGRVLRTAAAVISRPHQLTRARPKPGRHADGRGRRMIVERAQMIDSTASAAPPTGAMFSALSE